MSGPYGVLVIYVYPVAGSRPTGYFVCATGTSLSYTLVNELI